ALSGALSSAEQLHFEEWLAADPAHKSDFERLQALWSEAGNTLDHTAFDTDAAWVKVAAATGISEEPAKTVRMGIPSWLKMGIAAAVLMAGLFLYRFFDGSEEMVELLADTQNHSFVLPDQSQVTLRKGTVI